MAEINYSLDGLDEAIESFTTLKSAWSDKRSSVAWVSLRGSGGTPEIAHATAESYKGVYSRLETLSANTGAFLAQAKASMMKTDSSSPFE